MKKTSYIKLFYVSNMYPSNKYPYYGIFVKTIKKNLEAEGVLINEKVVLYKINNKVLKLLNYALFYLKIFYNGIFGNYDVIYCHFVSRSIFPLFIIKQIKKDRKLVINFHGTDLIVSGILKYFVKRAVEISDLVVVPSHFFKEQVIKKFRIYKINIFVSPSGGISRNFHKVSIKKNNGKYILGFVSNMHSEKGWKEFLKAVKELHIKGLPVKGIMIGDGNDSVTLKKIINIEELNDVVEYLGKKNHKELPFYYNLFDILIFPSKRESLGLVGLESMACGTPVIGSDIGAIRSYLKPGYNGYLFKTGNVSDLVKKIVSFFNLDENEKLQMSNNAQKTAEDYRREKVSKELYNALVGLL